MTSVDFSERKLYNSNVLSSPKKMEMPVNKDDSVHFAHQTKKLVGVFQLLSSSYRLKSMRENYKSLSNTRNTLSASGRKLVNDISIIVAVGWLGCTTLQNKSF